MKVLLVGINTSPEFSNPAVHVLKGCVDKAYSDSVSIREYVTTEFDRACDEIVRDTPDLLAFSCYIWNIDFISRLIPKIYAEIPKTDIWLGGPEVSFKADEVLSDFPEIAGVITGEGEQTFRELVALYADGEKDFQRVKGLVMHGLKTGERKQTDFDTVDSFDNLDDFKDRILYYESSRGCPFRCTYCLTALQKNIRTKSTEHVEKELTRIIRAKIPKVVFLDRTFNHDHERSVKIWDFIRRNDNGITEFSFEVAADIMTCGEKEILKKMRKGLVKLVVPVVSANEKTLKEINRKTDTDGVINTLSELKTNGNLDISVKLIAGLPYDDYESIKKSYDMMSGITKVELDFLKVLDGTVMKKKEKEYGLRYEDKPPYEIRGNRWLSEDDIERMKKWQ